MISLNNLTMGFSQRTLFKDVSLSIFPNEKIGLTGPNGAGKSTLFQIILGEREPVSGNVQIQKNINVGFLPQESQFSSKRTVMEEIVYGDRRLQSLMDEKLKLEENNRADSNRYGDVLHELEQLGIYDLEHKAEKILVGLGFKDDDFHRPIMHLSGGWQMRALLAKLLTHRYDLLLLDEPTNYLDLGATLWLKGFLRDYRGAFVLISHDRIFLNDVTNYTILLERGTMFKVKGNYEDFLEQKAIEDKTLERRQKEVEKKKEQLEKFTTRFHAQPNRAAAVRNKRKMIEKLEEESVDLPQEYHSIGAFQFSNIPASGYTVLRMDGIAKSYGDKKVYSDLSFEITKGQKICLVGPNGAGKSTLLKMVAGAIEPDAGSIRLGTGVVRGYFSQSRLDVLNPNRNVFEETVSACAGSVPQSRVRSLLGLFNFHGDDVFKSVQVLSGGEKSRVILAKLLINPPNFMLLDEPTTHLDLDGIKALTEAFKTFEGTMCFISHDLFFIKEVADTVVDVNQGVIKIYPGGLDYYLDKKAEKESLEAEQRKKSDRQQVKADKKPVSSETEHMKQMQQMHQQAIKRLSQIKDQVRKLEEEQKELEAESYAKSRKLSELYSSSNTDLIKEYSQRLKDIQSRLRDIESTILGLWEEKEKIEGRAN